MTDMRINARLDEESSSDLLFLKEALGSQSVTEVLKYSLKQVAEDIRNRQRAKQQHELWLASDFIGCMESSDDLSENYKASVAQQIDDKYLTE